HGGDARRERLVEIHHHHAGAGGDIGGEAAQDDVPRPAQHAAALPGERALEEVVARLAVLQCLHVDKDQAFVRVRDRGVAVDRMHRLLAVLAAHALALVAARGYRLVGRQGYAGGVARGDVRVVAAWRERCSDDALGDAFVRDRSDGVYAIAGLAFGDVQIFAAQLQAAHVAVDRMVVRLGELAA